MEKQKITVEDFQKIVLVSDPQLSPDGARIACVRKHIEAKKSKYRAEIWIVPTEDGEPRRFTGGDWSDSSPRWSPDGTRIAFLSDRKKPHSQIFVIPSDGGEASALTCLENEGQISSLRWSPDGTQIAFLFRETPEAYRKKAVEERKEKELPPPPRHHTRLFYRLDGFGYFDDSHFQVWVADANTGEARQLTRGACDCESVTWSPDSRTLAFLSDRRDDFDILPPQSDIWTVPAAGGDLTRIPSPPGAKEGLAWSPDGRHFAYAASPDPSDQWGVYNARLYVLPVEGGETARDLTGHTDQTLGYWTLSDAHEVGAGDLIQWTVDSAALFFPISAFGDTRLCFLGANGGEPTPITSEGQEMGGFSISANGRAVVTLGTPTAPQELFVLHEPDAQNASVRAVQRTHFNHEFLEATEIVTPEAVAIPNGEGGTVHGWLLRPVGFTEAQQYPLVLYVHGGPHTQYGNVFMHELQLLAAEGYVVLYTNPRGSKGYGDAHTAAIKGDWGGADYRDILAAADYGCALDYVDASRTALMGGSYGGFMTAWAVGHTTRFACAITDRLVGNLHSMSGTVDFPWRHGAYFPGNSWSNPTPLWERSPLTYAGNVTTPLLIIHSDGDLRCDVGQAEELFAALRHQGKTVEFVRYPAESSHGLSRTGPPNLRRDRLQRNLDWLNRYLKPDSQ